MTKRRSRFDDFVEHLAETGMVGEAAKRAGISAAMGSRYMIRLRELMGWQAR